VTQEATVFIYSLKDFKLVKKFGKAGEGPREFRILPQLPLNIDARTDQIIVNSFGKVSYFTKQGEFIKEVKTLTKKTCIKSWRMKKKRYGSFICLK
jgi:uncharacterized protein YlbG (UPF0298 family)